VVAKYIERNPIAASMVNSVSDYKHQSFFGWLHKSKYFTLLNNSKIFDMTFKEYSEYISTALDIDAIEIVYKSPKLVKKDGKLKILSKRIETFFEEDMDINRNINMKKAYDYGYTKSDIARFLSLNPSSVSRIV